MNKLFRFVTVAIVAPLAAALIAAMGMAIVLG
jgi:hypothetical protein